MYIFSISLNLQLCDIPLIKWQFKCVPLCQHAGLLFICHKIMFHKLMEKSELKIDGKSVCFPSVHLRVTTEELLITLPWSLVLESFSKTSLHTPVVIEIRQQEWTLYTKICTSSMRKYLLNEMWTEMKHTLCLACYIPPHPSIVEVIKREPLCCNYYVLCGCVCFLTCCVSTVITVIVNNVSVSEPPVLFLSSCGESLTIWQQDGYKSLVSYAHCQAEVWS